MKRLILDFLGLNCIVWCASLAVADDDVAYRRAMADAVRAAANHVLPSVVMIEIIGTTEGGTGEVEQDAPTSGVVVDADGYVIASSIVADKPSASILVVLPDGTRQTATVVAQDRHREFALLKVNSEQPLVAVELTSDVKLDVGQTLVAIGRYGADSSPMVSTGIFSAGGRLDGIALQTDARVPPAMYGGPLIDLYGNLLGILIPAVAEGGAESSTDWYDSGIAFAIPAGVIANKIERLKAGTDIKKGLIGIVGKSADLIEAGTEIAAVRTRSPAEKAGIKAGDRVIRVDGTTVRRHQEIRQVLGSFDAGEVVAIKLQRDGKEIDVEVTLADTIPPLQPQRLGVVVREATAEPAKTSVIVDAVVPGSPADGKLNVDDVIVRLGEATIDSAETLRRQMIASEPDAEVELTVTRADQEIKVTVTPQSVAGTIATRVPDAWKVDKPKPWNVEAIKLPEAANSAAYVAPPTGENADADNDRLGLLVLLLGPGEGAPEDVAEKWKTFAASAGVVICAIAPEDTTKWQPKELETIANFAAAMMKKSPIDSMAVAVAAAGGMSGGKSTAADSMALAAAISQSKTFFGAAISAETRPPAVRLRENEASASLQLLIPVAKKDDLPPWAPAIGSAGYPIVTGEKINESALLRWVRLLQAI